MIGLDTNVLVRYVVQDDAEPGRACDQLIETTLSDDEPGWIARSCFCEFVWVLEAAYGYARKAIVATLQRLFEVDRFRVEEPSLAWRALDAYRSGADFADALIALGNEHAGCVYTATFDRGAAKLKADALLLGEMPEAPSLSRKREGQGRSRDCVQAAKVQYANSRNTRSISPFHAPWNSSSLRSAGVWFASTISISGSR